MISYANMTPEQLIKQIKKKNIKISALKRENGKLKFTEHEVVQERDFAESLVETAQVIVLVLDANGSIVRFNKYMEEISGYSLEEVRGFNWFSTFLPVREYSIAENIFSISECDIQNKGLITSIIKKDENEKEIIWYNKTLKNSKGEPIGVLAVGQDISRQIQVEQQLHDSEEKYRFLVDNQTDMIVKFNTKGQLLYVSPSYCKKFGKTMGELLGEKFLPVIHKDDMEKAKQAIMKVHRPPYTSYVEERSMTKEGWRWISWKNTGVLDGENKVETIVAVGKDISERKKIEEQLRQSEKMEAIGQLAGGIAHDFNNQLTGVLGYADILREKIQGDDVLSNYAENIIKSVRRASGLTSQLLAFARKGKYLSEIVNIHSTIQEVVSLLERSVDKKIVIKQQLNANPPTTKGDSTQLQNALLNLALNARDAMPNGGELIFTTEIKMITERQCRDIVTEIPPGNYIKVEVKDTGTGMTKDVITHIFEPFYTTKDQGKGTGMGLAAVYGTMENHVGSISVDSEPGKGSIFTLLFPLTTQEMKSNKNFFDDDDYKRGNAKILIVDDEKMICDVANEMLGNLGYTVSTHIDCKKAIKYYSESWENIDLVILDMIMPEINGKEAFYEMRKINPKVKVFLSSGYSLDGDAQSALDDGVLDFVQKPFRIAELSRKIADVFQPDM